MKKAKSITFYAWLIWALSALFMFYKYVIEVSPSVMTHPLMRAFQLDGTTLGNFAASYYYAYLIMQIPVGILIDKFGPRKMTSFAILICGLGTILFSKSTSIFFAGSGRFFAGLGAAFAAVSCLKLTTSWFAHNRFAFMAGLMMTVGMLGAAGGVSPLSLFVSHFGWRSSMLQIGSFGIILALLFWMLVRDYPPSRKEGRHLKQIHLIKELKRLVKEPQTWLLSIFCCGRFAPVSAFGGLWGVSFVEAAYNLSRDVAGHYCSLIFVGFALGAPIAGYLSDKMGLRKPIMGIGVSLSILFLLVILYINPLPFFMLGLILFLFGFTISSFLLAFTIIREIHPKWIIGTAIGFMNSLNALFGGLADPLTGYLIDSKWDGTMIEGVRYFSVENYRFALTSIPIFLGCALLIFIFTKETYCKERHFPDSMP